MHLSDIKRLKYKQVLARVLPEPENTSGIIETIDENVKVHRAEILLIGAGVEFTAVGDIVHYNHNAIDGLDMEIDGQKCLFLHEDNHLTFNECSERSQIGLQDETPPDHTVSRGGPALVL